MENLVVVLLFGIAAVASALAVTATYGVLVAAMARYPFVRIHRLCQ